MNKKLLPLLGLLASGIVLVGCGQTVPPQDRTYQYSPTKLSLNYNSLNMYKGDSVEIKAQITPQKAYDAKLTYGSTNEAVAVVDENGVVTAVETGTATITIGYARSDAEEAYILRKIPVRISKKVTKVDTLTDKIQAMYDYQVKNVQIDKVRSSEMREITTYKNGELLNQLYEDTFMTTSLSEAYFEIEEVDTEIKTTSGDVSYEDFFWCFYTDADYISYMYHAGSGVRNMMIVPSQSFLGKGRVEAVYHILDTIFSSGRAVMENVYENVYSTSELVPNFTKYISLVTSGGFTDDTVSYVLTQNNYVTTSDYDDERYSDIPYGVSVIQDYTQNIIWEKGIVRTIDIKQSLKYNYKGDSYVKDYVIQYSFEVNDEVTINKPNNKEFNLVGDLFDL